MNDIQLRRRLAELRQREEDIEAALNRKIGRRPAAKDAFLETSRALPVGSVLVEYVSSRFFDFRGGPGPARKPANYFAFVLKTGTKSPTRIIKLGEAAVINRAITELRARITGFKDDWEAQKFAGDAPVKSEQEEEAGYREAASNLYKLVFAPVSEELADTRVGTLYVSPDSELNLVPFESLADEAGHYLVEKYRVAYLTSWRDLLPSPSPKASGTVVFAAPSYDMPATARARKTKEMQGAAEARVGRVPGRHVINVRTPVSVGLPEEVVNKTRKQTRSHGWDALKASAEEAKGIADKLAGTTYADKGGVTLYIGDSALEETFKRVALPRVLHVATHGFFPGEALETPPSEMQATQGSGLTAVVGQRLLQAAHDPLLSSGLVLAGANRLGERVDGVAVDDGWVTAEEISNMNLQGTELVVLSACGTGLGGVSSGEGVYGLRRAFRLAGARAIISTLFEVPDGESRDLMLRFYENLARGKGKLDALREAQLSVIAESRSTKGAAHPFFWSAFTLSGKPDK